VLSFSYLGLRGHPNRIHPHLHLKIHTAMIIRFTSYGLFMALFLWGCQQEMTLEKYGEHYQEHQDFQSLNKIVELLPLDTDTSALRRLLGEPIDMGFDFRYLLDSAGPNGCVVGAVFHVNELGKTDQQWLGEICE
jgi:hypothetical protein